MANVVAGGGAVGGGGAGKASRQTAIVWFRNDLRLRDNTTLHLAEVSKAKHLVGVYCFDDRFENARTRVFRQQAVAELSRNFARNFGTPFIVCQGQPEQVVPSLARKIQGGGHVVCSTESASYEQKVNHKLVGNLPEDWDLVESWNYSMYHPEDIKGFDVLDGDLAEPFTKFRKDVEDAHTPIRKPLAIPKLQVSAPSWTGALSELPGYVENPGKWSDPDLVSFEQALPQDPAPAGPHALHFRGGEDAGQLRLDQFCQHGLATYKKTRNQSVGWNYSTKLSPWLAAGCISPRQIHHRVADFEDQHGVSVDTYWVTFELLWRDYMRFFLIKYGNKVFHEAGPAGRVPGSVEWWPTDDERVPARIDAWRTGRTGVPWVDGHMRELAETGFMSNRGRQNVASFLIHNLNVDWRLGAQHFEDNLIDHDVSANWVNWVMAAGCGFAGQRVNKFNMDKQARDYDPEGRHAKAWIPELPSSVRGMKTVHELALRPPRKESGGSPGVMDAWLASKPGKGPQQAHSAAPPKAPQGQYPAPIVRISRSQVEPGKFSKKREHTGRHNRKFYTH